MQLAPARLALALSLMLACGCSSSGGNSSVASRLWPFGKDNAQLASNDSAPKVSLPSQTATPTSLSGSQLAASGSGSSAPSSTAGSTPTDLASNPPLGPYQQAGYSTEEYSQPMQDSTAPQYGQNYAMAGGAGAAMPSSSMPNTQAGMNSPQVGRYNPANYSEPVATEQPNSHLGDRYADYSGTTNWPSTQSGTTAGTDYSTPAADYRMADSGTRYGGGSENQAARYGDTSTTAATTSPATGDRYSNSGVNYIGGGSPGDGYQPPQVPDVSQSQGIPAYQSPIAPYQSPAAGYQTPSTGTPAPFRPGSTGRSLDSLNTSATGSSMGTATQANYAPTTGNVPPSYTMPAAGPNYLP